MEIMNFPLWHLSIRTCCNLNSDELLCVVTDCFYWEVVHASFAMDTPLCVRQDPLHADGLLIVEAFTKYNLGRLTLHPC